MIMEHKRALQTGETNVSTLADHAWRVGHDINWDSMTILGVSSGYYSSLALEAVHIRDQKKPLNTDSGHLDTIYNTLLYSYKQVGMSKNT